MAEGYDSNSSMAVQDVTSNVSNPPSYGTWHDLSVKIIGRVAYVQFGFIPSQNDLKNTTIATGFPIPKLQPIHTEPEYYTVEIIARDNFGKVFPMYIFKNGGLGNRNVEMTSGRNIYCVCSYIIE